MSAEAKVYRNSLRFTIGLVALLFVAAAIIGPIVAGTPGFWSAIAGAAIAGVAAATTQAAMLVGHRRPPQQFVGILLGSWLVKMLIIVIGLVVLGNVDSIHRGLLAGFAAAGIVGSLTIDMVFFARGRVPYVDSRSPEASE